MESVDTRAPAARIEVDRDSLADLIMLVEMAAHELRTLNPTLADGLHGAVTQVQVETYLAG